MAMPTLEGLKEWFFMQTEPGQATAWRLYRGSQTSKQHDGGFARSEDPESAWEKLRSHLENEEWEPGEYVTIRIYKNGNGNLNGGGSDMVYRPISKTNFSRSGIAGINGGNDQAYIAAQVQKEIEIYDLRRQVQDLEQAMEDRQNIGERILNTIVEHPSFDPNALINGIGALLSNLMPKRANVGVTGFDEQPAAAGSRRQPSEAADQAERISSALTRLQAHFPDQPIENLLEKLADFVDTNPVVAKNVLQNILQ